MPVTADSYESLRPLAFAIAYRMLGTVSEAEDVVQEAFLRLYRNEDEVESPKAFLATVTTRLSIDTLRSARMRRETYPGPWLPEPVVTDAMPDSDSVSMALLVTLESLNPVERAVFLLHDVFDYGYDEIAEIVGRTRDNCRQLALRARRAVDAGRARYEPAREQQQKLAGRFFAAAREGDMDGLVELLAEDATMYGDGGGIGQARTTPLHGGEKIARFILGLMRQAERSGITLAPAELNGAPGAIARGPDGAVVSTLSLDFDGDRIRALRSQVNPEKLGHLRPED
jgi:RNA polymerase sigma-70 factor (ECF subfamily)